MIRRIPWYCLLGVLPAIAWCWATFGFEPVPMWEISPEALAARRPVNLRKAKVLATDAGRAIPAYRAVDMADSDELHAVDQLVTRNFTGKLDPRDEPSLGYNCHGWVFTGGEFWIQSEQVEQILQDNGYVEVKDVRAGDLVLYRGALGAIVHSGVVYAVDEDQVWVESKWGKSGRYVHEPEDQIYSSNFVYLRSGRTNGHCLWSEPMAPSTSPRGPAATQE